MPSQPDKRLKTTRPVANLRQGRNDWYRIENRTASGPPQVFIYDEIGYFGVTASDFAKELQDLDTKAFDLHVNSPGGDVFDGVAIYNAIKNHKANVTVYVDGLAASAASFIAMAGDTVLIERNAQIMIHDAMGMSIGNAADARVLADLLDKASDNIADIYSQKTGTPAQQWRSSMKTETWYSAQEALAAGLVDAIAGDEGKSTSNTWDLSIYAYNGRQEAPSPDITPMPQVVPDEPEFQIDLDAIRSALQGVALNQKEAAL